ncbi:DUF5684 domain-containing protein [Streptococcus dentasini]
METIYTNQDLIALAGYAIALGIGLAFILMEVIVNAVLFQRAGESWWKAIIPFYNNFTKHKISFGEENKWFWFLLIFGIYDLYTNFSYVRSYGKSLGFCVFAVILRPIASLVMLIQGDRYQGPRPHVLRSL